MNGQGELPDCVVKDAKEEFRGEYYKKEIKSKPIIWTVLVWTMYVFQIAIALPAVYYGWAMPEGYEWSNHWSIVANILGSLFVVSWIEKNIMNRDDYDG